MGGDAGPSAARPGGGAGERGGRAEPPAHGGTGNLFGRAQLQVAAGLSVAFQQAVGIGERAVGPGQDQVHVRLEGGQRAHRLARQRVEGHAPFDRRRGLGLLVVYHRALLVLWGARGAGARGGGGGGGGAGGGAR